MAYNWKDILKFTVGLSIAGYWVACSPKKFDKDPTFDACQNFNQTCVATNGIDYFDYTINATGGLADILIVNDNSGSMSFEQNLMAARFSTFISQLEAKNIDYRIGVITTDISSNATATTADNYTSSPLYNPSRAINGNGALQDGKLITFPNGQPYLSSTMGSFADREAWFKAVIKRPETASCEAFLQSYPSSQPPAAGLHAACPSGDERGIFAANMFLSANHSSFVRPRSALSIIFLADEDERSGLYKNTTATAYKLEDKDEPASLVAVVNSKFAGKSFKAHAIVAADNQCVLDQSYQLATFNPLLGSMGSKYLALANMTTGIVGDICANDYGSQLTDIATEVGEQIQGEVLACSNPKNLVVTLTPANPAITHVVSGKQLTFSQVLPAGTKARYQYSCDTIL